MVFLLRLQRHGSDNKLSYGKKLSSGFCCNLNLSRVWWMISGWGDA